jgi:hypothetical protein
MIEDDDIREQVHRLDEQKALEQEAIRQAVDFIAGILTEIAVMGANDSEYSIIAEIKNNLVQGKISPSKAREEALKIKSKKMDYH